MPKALCISGMVISVLVLILFGMDISMGVPFHGASSMLDITFIVCAVLVGYLSWATFREQL